MEKIVVSAHPDHIFRVASNMTEADRLECAAGGLGPFRALSMSLENSAAAWTGLVNDEPVWMMGVTALDILAGIGSPWLLTTPEAAKSAKTFLKSYRFYLGRMLELFPVLTNFVDARHEVAIRWLRWLGFEFGNGPVPYGPFGAPFYRFEMRSE